MEQENKSKQVIKELEIHNQRMSKENQNLEKNIKTLEDENSEIRKKLFQIENVNYLAAH